MAGRKVKIGIIGTGGMARMHAQLYQQIPGCEVTAACDISLQRVTEYGDSFGIPQRFTQSNELLASGNVDAVSIVTPDASHMPLSLEALKAGKHVLCEKPLALTFEDARKMASAANRAGLINMVNFSYRNGPAIHQARKMVEQGKIGNVRHVHAHYLQSWLVQGAWGDWKTTPAWLWRLSTKHGSKGVLGDIGVHIVDYASYPIGEISGVFCKLQTFPKAKGNRIGEYRLDANDSALITAEFRSGAVATIHTTRFAAPNINELKLNIYGDEGSLEVINTSQLNFWPVRKGKLGKKQEVALRTVPNIHQLFIKGVRSGRQEEPAFSRGVEVQRVLDACFDSDQQGRMIRLKPLRK